MSGAGRNIFETLTSEPLERFVLTFEDNLAAVYEYDSQEIQEFLLSLKAETEAQQKDILFDLRQVLHEKLHECFPDASYDVSSLYNRKKTEALVKDIYIIGHSVVNKLEDKRLKSVYKNCPGNSTDTSAPVIDESLLTDGNETLANVTAVCIQLKVSVMELTKTVTRLQDDIKSLTTQLESQQNQGNCVLCENRMNNIQMTASVPVQNSAGPPVVSADSASDAEQQILPENENAIDTSENTQTGDGEGVNRPSATETLTQRDPGFTLPQQQRRQAKQGRLFTEVLGSATRSLTISGAVHQNQITARPRSIYIGKLSESTTPHKLRQHLREVGVMDITDVIDLHCKIPGRSSFCVIVDSQVSEDAIYNASNWPLGAKVRPYREKKQMEQQSRTSRIGPRFNRDRKRAAHGPAANNINANEKTSPSNQQWSGSSSSAMMNHVPQTPDGAPSAQATHLRCGSNTPNCPLSPLMWNTPRPVQTFPFATQTVSPSMFSNRFSPLMDVNGMAWLPTRLA
jgi:hypothetical protein